MNVVKDSKNNFLSAEMDKWFDGMINELTVDKMMIESNIADKSKIDFYNTITSGNSNTINQLARVQSSQHFIKELLRDYITQLLSYNRIPGEIAFDLSDAKILVWAKINNDDDKTEDALLLAEAKANSKFYDYGFFISSTIVEDRDSLSIPPHYTELKLN
jgi:hypothetical protein